MAIKKILLRRDSRANWEANNPVLSEGEIGVILDGPNSTIKIGAYKNSETGELYTWNELPEIQRTDKYLEDYIEKGEAQEEFTRINTLLDDLNNSLEESTSSSFINSIGERVFKFNGFDDPASSIIYSEFLEVTNISYIKFSNSLKKFIAFSENLYKFSGYLEEAFDYEQFQINDFNPPSYYDWDNYSLLFSSSYGRFIRVDTTGRTIYINGTIPDSYKFGSGNVYINKENDKLYIWRDSTRLTEVGYDIYYSDNFKLDQSLITSDSYKYNNSGIKQRYLNTSSGVIYEWENNSLIEYVEIKDGSITTEKLADSAVTEEKIASNAITGDKISRGSIKSSNIGPGEIKLRNLNSEVLTASNITFDNTDTSITGSDIQAVIKELSDNKQEKLVSGTNVKTINNQSILGNGNISTLYDDTELKSSINTLSGRIDTLVNDNAGEAIDTFNEITEFLSGIENTETLDGILGGIGEELSKKANTSSLATVATSGSYNDLINVPTASTGAYGVTKLSDSTSSTSTSLAATANAVKQAYDLANSAVKSSELANYVTNQTFTEVIEETELIVSTAITDLEDKKVNSSDLHAVATSGSYNDLTDKPTIPTNYKTIQTSVSSPSTSGSTTAFIDTISQDTNGKITVTKKNVQFPTAVTSISGKINLSYLEDNTDLQNAIKSPKLNEIKYYLIADSFGSLPSSETCYDIPSDVVKALTTTVSNSTTQTAINTAIAGISFNSIGVNVGDLIAFTLVEVAASDLANSLGISLSLPGTVQVYQYKILSTNDAKAPYTGNSSAGVMGLLSPWDKARIDKIDGIEWTANNNRDRLNDINSHRYTWGVNMDDALENGIYAWVQECRSGNPGGIIENFSLVVNRSSNADPNYYTIQQTAYGRTGLAANRVWTRMIFKLSEEGSQDPNRKDDFTFPWVEVSNGQNPNILKNTNFDLHETDGVSLKYWKQYNSSTQLINIDKNKIIEGGFKGLNNSYKFDTTTPAYTVLYYEVQAEVINGDIFTLSCVSRNTCSEGVTYPTGTGFLIRLPNPNPNDGTADSNGTYHDYSWEDCWDVVSHNCNYTSWSNSNMENARINAPFGSIPDWTTKFVTFRYLGETPYTGNIRVTVYRWSDSIDGEIAQLKLELGNVATQYLKHTDDTAELSAQIIREEISSVLNTPL